MMVNFIKWVCQTVALIILFVAYIFGLVGMMLGLGVLMLFETARDAITIKS